MYTLITNANPILSTLIFGRTREVLFNPLVECITSEFTTWEVKKYIPSFARKLQQQLERTGTIISIAQIEEQLFSELGDLPIETVHPRFYEDKLADAERLIGHRDPKDIDLLALALKTDNPIWSDDKDFEGNYCTNYPFENGTVAPIVGLTIEEILTVMENEQWLATMQSEHFIYRMEGERPWSPATIVELLEGCYREYYKMMGPGLKTWIEVEDRLCPSGKRAARRINGKIICEFPDGFGNVRDELELAYHFFAHEVFHHWVGGYTVSYGMAIEALTQYMANRILVKLEWVASDKLIRALKTRLQYIDMGVQVELSRYYLLFGDLEAQKGEAALYKLCCELAECFRVVFSAGEKADVAPILRSYLGSDIDKSA